MEPIIEKEVKFSDAVTDEERYEFAQYIVNTPAEDRPEIPAAEAAKALSWMEGRKQ